MKTKKQIKNEYLTELKNLYKKHNESSNRLKNALDGGFSIKEEKEITHRYLKELKELEEKKKINLLIHEFRNKANKLEKEEIKNNINRLDNEKTKYTELYERYKKKIEAVKNKNLKK